MTTTTLPPRLDDPVAPAARGGFGRVLRAEWTKFRTVRGWVIAVLLAAVLIDGFGLFAAGQMSIGCGEHLSGKACYQALPTGPGGQAVTDTFYFVRQPLTGDGGLTVRLTSMTGHYSTVVSGAAPNPDSSGPPQGTGVEATQPWSKVGIILKAGLTPGSAYAAMTQTGSHGTRMQWNYTHDAAGLPGTASPAAPRWLRLTRSGDTVAGYDSVDGVTWAKVATAHLAGLPSTVQIGLFATSPEHVETTRSFGGTSGTGGPSTATGTFDHLTRSGAPAGAGWTAGSVGDTHRPGEVSGGPGAAGGDSTTGYRSDGDEATVTGSGDIAPVVVASGPGAVTTIENHLVGTFVGLLVLVVVAATVATAEYRRGLVRVTFAAVPRRGQVLAAKATVLAAVAFVVGVAAAGVAVPVGVRMSRDQGAYVLPVSWLTEARVIVGTGALLAVAAVLAVAVGVILRRGAAAVATVIVGIVLPYFLGVASVLPLSAAQWVLRVTPAAGFAIAQSIPRYSQVTADYAPPDYLPLAPWAGLAVLCAWAVAALAVAYVLLRRRDA
jgi:ABC-type transport system involved in multi-copper enzyme maturation permease subunit